MRIAWFSPLPPSRSGIAAYSAELLPLLRARYETIDVFVDHRPAENDPGAFSAHDVVWKHRRNPYDLTVFHLGNASCHDYMWAYLFRYPGLVVLHDAQLHQARALWLTKRWRPRRDDYVAEFQANHPEAPADVAELVAAGLGGLLYQHWPLIRLVLAAARLTVVHNRRLLADLEETYPGVALDAIEMGVADGRMPKRGLAPFSRSTDEKGAKPLFGIPELPPDAVVVAAFGGLTPEKRIGPLIRAISAIADRHPHVHLLLVGAEAEHYDVREEARRWGVADRVHVTGYVSDADLPAYLARADVCACLRWPTNRETSASWLRCLAAGRPTIITDLTHLADLPTLDPRGWIAPGRVDIGAPIAISIDILDEDHSLQLALDRLADDEALRKRIGAAARAWWAAHHRLESMADAYERVIGRARTLAPSHPALPAHLTADGSDGVRSLAEPFGVETKVADFFA